MTRNALLIDAAIAVILALLVIVLSPGWAVVGLIAIVVLLACGVAFALGAIGTRWRRRRRSRSRPRPPAPRPRARP